MVQNEAQAPPHQVVYGSPWLACGRAVENFISGRLFRDETDEPVPARSVGAIEQVIAISTDVSG